MTQMICDVCYKTFPGPGTLCPECASVEGVSSGRRLAAIQSRLGGLHVGRSQPQLYPASRSLRLLAALAETLFCLPFTFVATLFSVLFLEPGDLLFLERYIENRGHDVSLLESSGLLTAMQVQLALTYLLLTFYVFVFEASPLQGTIGKVMLGLKVVDRHGDRPSFARILVRTLGRWVVSLPVLAVFLGQYLWMVTHHAPHGMLQNYVLAGGLLTLGGMGLVQVFDDGLVLFSKHRQALHDMVADTFVVLDEPPTATRVLCCFAIAVIGNALSIWLNLP